MSEQKANQLYRYMMAETFLYAPVTVGSFMSSDRIMIFWGPGQYTISYPAYDPPNPDLWRTYEHLNIPEVARFIYSNEEVTGDDDYSDDDSGGGGDPPPFYCPGYQYEVKRFVSARLARSALYDRNDYFSGGPTYPVIRNPAPPAEGFFAQYVNVNSPVRSSQAAWDGDTGATVEIYDSITNTLISTSTPKACPLLKATPVRDVEWYVVCGGGGLPPGGTKRFVETITASMPDGSDSAAPPRCFAPLLVYDLDTDAYIPQIPIVNATEVTFQARNWYGCDEPGGPRTPPPPPTPFPIIG